VGECPYCLVELEYAGTVDTADGSYDAYECPECGTRQLVWLLDAEPEGGE